jgi:hypothetical protein
VAGKLSKLDPAALEREYDEKAAGSVTKLKALAVAVDETGNRLADEIAASREEWIDGLVEADAEASARYDRAIREAQEALAEIGPTRNAIRWLEEFDCGAAHAGLQTQFPGGRVRLPEMRLPQGDVDPAQLLTLAAKVTDQPPVRAAA